ncbi:hypothetical protein IT084_00425 [Desulfallas sp. Bu1-1]|uniref:M1 family aminopeptidase n=1 Tax=Desulfallas sp. Bu1-1 TaxID=2787620 RepID=UPI00189F39A3|nr:M1 family aminopeptidase [Desulfallas sp. Bu1-1]MBF7081446.1 hypothetical protein [Desulfallas sp. Bu1-1]
MKITGSSWIEKLLEELDDEVVTLYRRGRYPEAIKLAEKSVRIATQAFGAGHTYAKSAVNNLNLIRKAYNEQVLGEQNGTAAGNRLSPKGKPSPGTGYIFAPKAVSLVSLVLIILISALFVGASFIPVTEEAGVSASPAHINAYPLPYYRVKAVFYPQHKMIEGEQEVVFEFDEPRREAVFNLYLNRYQNDALNSSEIRRYALKRGMDPGYIDIQRVSCEGKKVSFREDGELLMVTPEKGVFDPGEHRLKIGFRVKIPFIADRVGGNEQGIWLGNWLPTLCIDPRGYKPTEIGDPYVNYSSTYEFLFTVPGGYDLVLSNAEIVEERENARVYHGILERVRDLPVFLNRGYKEAVAREGETEIRYYYTSRNSDEVLDAAKKAVAFYTGTVGAYPWKQLNIVENDMYLDGMEYSTMVLISTRAIKNNPARTVFHEVGHQWFYNIIGNDQYHHPFMDEGLVEFISKYALDDKTPRFWPGIRGLDRNLGEFGSWRQYRDVHYANGEKLFENIYFTLGKEGFDRFLRDYYNRFKFRLVTLDQFERFVAEQTGQPFDQFINNK